MSATKFFFNLIRIKLHPSYVIKNAPKDKQSRDLIATLSDAVIGGIAFFGDSIVSNWNLSKYFSEPVYNAGIGGDCTSRALLRFDTTIAPLAPRAIVIHIGDNDLKYGYPIKTAAKNLGLLICKAMSIPSVKRVIVDSAPPVNRSFGNMPGLCTNRKVDRLNKQIQAVCEAKGAAFVNTNALLKDANGNLRADWTTDGMHLTEEAYCAVSQKLNEAL